MRSLGGRRIVADGLEHGLWTDFYHNAMTASWPAFFAALAAAFVALNIVFAFVYALGDDPIANARPGSFSDLFFFSVETTSTVGYGDMHPQTIYGHIVATVRKVHRPGDVRGDDRAGVRAVLAAARAAHFRQNPVDRRP